MSSEAAPAQSQGCPVDHGNTQQASSSSSWSPTNWFQSSSAATATATASTMKPESALASTQVISGGGCPVKHDKADGAASPLPASIEEAARHAQAPHADQLIALSTHRVISTIPRADELRESAATHQPKEETDEHEGNKWVYPSEQQFYNAMRRKGWQGIDEATMPSVVRIHNAVNERGWTHVRKWENELHSNPNPRLVRFLGRPKDMSPRAFLNTYLFWYNAPFDRHDWFVDRGDGKEPRRYVIDFYNGNEGDDTNNANSGIVSSILNRFSGQPAQIQQPPRPPTMYLDVRPALDTPEAFSDRLKMFFIDGFPGIYAAFKQTPSA